MPAGNTYEAIATQTLGAGATSVTFSSISGSYTDLVLVTSALSPGGGNNSRGYRFELNSDTGTNYSQTWLTNSTTTAVSSRESNETRGRIGGISETASNVTTVLTTFLNYSNATTYKTVLSRSSNLNTNGDTNVFAGVSLWRSTSAITAIKLTMSDNSSFITGSSFSLYGILAA
jgi:hypothetical protein